ncbi:MAG: thiosulfate oxidation carrier protein SoxY [Pseudazoarcus pumilus]|nr:thiosulfate oxidation carrier protein SoxY [Pseudazoarcus pumilus]
MNHQRRDALKTGGGLGIFGMLVAAGLVKPGSALARDQKVFDAKSIDEAFAALGAGKPEASDQVQIVAPDIAENGAVVPVGVNSALPGTESVSIMVEKNPNMVAANFMLPEGTMGEVQTRIKMGQTSDVYAVVKANGKYYMAKKEIKVTLGGCGG